MQTLAPRRMLVIVGFTITVFIIYTLQSLADTDYTTSPIHRVGVSQLLMHGDAIMPKLGNETEKAELGRASWKLFHTMMARFPEEPTQDERDALEAYVHLFARLYPCGECAGHFRQILTKFPPQTSSRSTAAAWACHVHNVVNKSLRKGLFDCSKIGDAYKCGCAETEEEAKDKEKTGEGEIGSAELVKKGARMKLEREGWTQGG